MRQRLTWSHRLGLVLAVPFLLLALAQTAAAVWEARPLPVCRASGIDPLNPVRKCRRVPVPVEAPGERGPGARLTMIEQGTVSAMPDLRAAGMSALAALALYLGSRGLGAVIGRRTRAVVG